MPALLGHTAITYYAQNYAGIIHMSLIGSRHGGKGESFESKSRVK